MTNLKIAKAQRRTKRSKRKKTIWNSDKRMHVLKE
jgi:hypothetical protein